MIGAFLKGLRDACFPLQCIACQREGELWCSACRAGFLCRLEQHCPSCDQATPYGRACHRHADNVLDGAVAAAWYANPNTRLLIDAWKYKFIREAEPFIESVITQWINQAQPVPTYPWTIVPLPLHPLKRRQRGFDQAAVFATMLGYELGAPVRHDVLVRTRFVFTPQAKIKKRDQRERRGKKKLFSVVATDVPSHVLLVDDVYTTGATMRSAARELKGTGAKVVWGLALARGD